MKPIHMYILVNKVISQLTHEKLKNSSGQYYSMREGVPRSVTGLVLNGH